MNHPNHSAEAALPAQTPLFASSWMALFHLIRGRLLNQRRDDWPANAGKHTQPPG